MSQIYLSSSWKNRDRVRAMAQILRKDGWAVYDFTDPKCRTTPLIPPERFPEQFDPERHRYAEYISSVPEWRAAVEGNKRAIQECEVVILLLPCGLDAHADAYYGLGLGKHLIVVGHHYAGERTLAYLWAHSLLEDDADIVQAVRDIKRAGFVNRIRPMFGPESDQ
jgi:hypothetical protein